MSACPRKSPHSSETWANVQPSLGVIDVISVGSRMLIAVSLVVVVLFDLLS